MSKTENIIWITFFIFGIVFFCIGTVICINIFDTSGKVSTTATISKIDTIRSSSGDVNHRVYVLYNVNGKQYESILNAYSSSFYKGKNIEIYYDGDNPVDISSKELGLVMLVMPCLGCIFTIIGGSGIASKIKKKAKKRKLIKKADIIYANYDNSSPNMLYSVNGLHPYVITCNWTDEIENKTYIFKSENIWYDPTRVISERNIITFPIYIDRGNMKNYYMDINCIRDSVIDLR